MALRQRLADALGVGVKAPSDAQSFIAALLPSGTSQPPERGATGMLKAYNNSPWVRAITSRVSTSVGAASWQVYATKMRGSGRFYRDFALQEAGIKRRDFKRKTLDVPEGVELVQIPVHPALELLNGGSYRMPGSIGRQMTQLYIELTGEAFWLLDPRRVAGEVIPAGFYVIPPTWVQDVPTDEVGVYTIVGPNGHQVNVPREFMIWFSNPNPVAPYGRGVGHLRAFGDEIDTDEYTAKYIRAFFYNSARPDLLVYGKDLQKEDLQRLEYGWLQKVRGFMQAHKPFFLNRDVTIKELTYKFKEMQLIELRKWERDLLVNGRGIPPEVLGIIENSNRATIDAADYLFAKGVIEPALEFLRTFLQAELMPMYDARLVLGYTSPIEEDWDFQLRAMELAPWAPTVNEWRAMQGLDAIENGDVHVFQLAQKAVDLSEPDPFAGPSRNDEPPNDEGEAFEGAFEKGLGSEIGSGTYERQAGHRHVRKADRMPPMATPPRAALSDPGKAVLKFGGPAYVDLAERLGKQMADDLFAAWREMRGFIDVDALIGALSVGDIDAAVAIVEGTDVAEALEPARQTLREALWMVGSEAAREIAEAFGVDFTFEMISPEALEELRKFGAAMVKDVSEATKAAIRQALVDAYAEGETAQEVARKIRNWIGLTERDWKLAEKRVARWRELGYSEAKIEDMIEKWVEKKIAERAETIALNELVYAANRGQEMAWNAAVRAGFLDPNNVEREWIAAGDERMCEICEQGDGMRAPLNEPFPNGFDRPNDSHIRCRCTEGLVFLK